MRALVTGASGFAGSALCAALLREGHEVVGLTRNLSRAQRGEAPRGVRWVEGGVGDPNQVAGAARGCEVLFHAAGIRSVVAPTKVLRWVHVAGTENVLVAARHAGVRRVVHMSCADVSLHAEDRMHWDEKRVLPHAPLGPHARTKLMAEDLALAASDDRLEVTALRPATLWGAGDIDGVAALVREARAGGVRLYGGGRNILATAHIDNVVRAALSAATADAAPSRAYYITDGEFIEARELYGKLLSSLGLPPARLDGQLTLAATSLKLRSLFDRAAEGRLAHVLGRAHSALFDLSRATADLGYRPAVDLETGISALSEWVRSLGGLTAVVALARPAPCDADVAEQIRAAGGD